MEKLRYAEATAAIVSAHTDPHSDAQYGDIVRREQASPTHATMLKGPSELPVFWCGTRSLRPHSAYRSLSACRRRCVLRAGARSPPRRRRRGSRGAVGVRVRVVKIDSRFQVFFQKRTNTPPLNPRSCSENNLTDQPTRTRGCRSEMQQRNTFDALNSTSSAINRLSKGAFVIAPS